MEAKQRPIRDDAGPRGALPPVPAGDGAALKVRKEDQPRAQPDTGCEPPGRRPGHAPVEAKHHPLLEDARPRRALCQAAAGDAAAPLPLADSSAPHCLVVGGKEGLNSCTAENSDMQVTLI